MEGGSVKEGVTTAGGHNFRARGCDAGARMSRAGGSVVSAGCVEVWVSCSGSGSLGDVWWLEESWLCVAGLLWQMDVAQVGFCGGFELGVTGQQQIRRGFVRGFRI